MKYNEENGITPETIKKNVHGVISATIGENVTKQEKIERAEKERTIKELTVKMKQAAELLQFELAAKLRDEIKSLQEG